jgi:tetratricopeptide (TPR) repeat protein
MRVSFLLYCCLLSLAPLSLLAQGAEDRFLVEGVQALAAGDAAAAERSFRSAVQASPELTPAWIGLADALRRLDRPDEALEAARKASDSAPDSSAAALTLGRHLAQSGARDEALKELARARSLAPDNPDAYVLEALVLRDLGRTADATELLEGAWARPLRTARLSEQLALLLLAEDRFEQALDIATVGLEIAPGTPGIELARGLSLAALGRASEAVEPLRNALDGDLPEPDRIRVELATVLTTLGRHTDAVAYLETASRGLSQDPALWYKLASARRAAGNVAGADDALKRFAELQQGEESSEREGKEIGIALNEAQNLAASNRMEEALEKTRRLLAQAPDEPRALALQAKLLFSLGQRRDALDSISRARTLSPAVAEYPYLQGLFLLSLGDAAAAERSLRAALTLKETLPEAHSLLGGALAKQGLAEEAVAHFARALELGLDQPQLRLGYAGALEDLGRQDEAEAQMQAYRRLRPAPGR